MVKKDLTVIYCPLQHHITKVCLILPACVDHIMIQNKGIFFILQSIIILDFNQILTTILYDLLFTY